MFDALLPLNHRPGDPPAPKARRISIAPSGARSRHQEKRYPVPPNPWKLSAYEAEILRRLCEGASVAGIAKDMSMSAKTAATHLWRAKQKIGANSQSHMCVIFDRYMRSNQVADVEVVLRMEGGRPTVELREIERAAERAC